ncbi:phosphopantetheine-binding protein [Rhizobium etli]|uniref:phosphopantetheine-binding protein n=1 Tax=Rhizobium etli TaxID=29449 RepID=UPI000383A518|nr:phosphopantetheine-binding protein [Rhizobium etli]AGS25449.1 phosphopantetheine-binding nodulation protein NodF [Rhizobium etli bv. mimosae str. Mim1]
MADRLAIEIIDKIKTLGDLEIQSLELTEIVFDLEDAYGIEIEMDTSEAWSNLTTVGDIVEATRALIASKS